ALNAKTGALLWKYNTGQDIQAAATVVNGVVYVGTTSGTLFALNAGNGALLWKYAFTGVNIYTYPPTVINGVLYFTPGFQSPYLSAFDGLTGALLWKKGAGFFEPTDIAVASNTVYMVGGSTFSPTLYAYDAKTGTQLWNSNLSDRETYGVVTANGVL